MEPCLEHLLVEGYEGEVGEMNLLPVDRLQVPVVEHHLNQQYCFNQ